MAAIDLKIVMTDAMKTVLNNANDILKKQRELSDEMARLLLEEIERRTGDGWHDAWTTEDVPIVLDEYAKSKEEEITP